MDIFLLKNLLVNPFLASFLVLLPPPLLPLGLSGLF